MPFQTMKKILLDENLPHPLTKLLAGDLLEVVSIHDMGWSEKKNGELLRAMLQEGFEYLLTADKNLQNQQNLEKTPVKLVVVRTYDNRYKTLVQYVEIIQQTILGAPDDLFLIEIDLRNLKA